MLIKSILFVVALLIAGMVSLIMVVAVEDLLTSLVWLCIAFAALSVGGGKGAALLYQYELKKKNELNE